jgi:DNA-binding MarR family transcriptional regulator
MTKKIDQERGKSAQLDLLRAPGHLLRRNHQRSQEIFSKLVGEDITRQQIALLIALSDRPGASQNELVAATGIDKSTLKEMLGRMIKRGWVSRDRDPKDSRAWTMHVTPEGAALLAERMALVAETQREILAPLPEHMRADFILALRILIGLEPPPA